MDELTIPHIHANMSRLRRGFKENQITDFELLLRNVVTGMNLLGGRSRQINREFAEHTARKCRAIDAILRIAAPKISHALPAPIILLNHLLDIGLLRIVKAFAIQRALIGRSVGRER